jgi:hypothetical protein
MSRTYYVCIIHTYIYIIDARVHFFMHAYITHIYHARASRLSWTKDNTYTYISCARIQTLMDEGFLSWGTREFGAFKRASERYGRSNYEAIAREMGDNKSADEVKKYAQAFWSRGPKVLRNFGVVEQQIVKGEEKLKRRQHTLEMIQERVSKYARPLEVRCIVCMCVRACVCVCVCTLEMIQERVSKYARLLEKRCIVCMCVCVCV